MKLRQLEKKMKKHMMKIIKLTGDDVKIISESKVKVHIRYVFEKKTVCFNPKAFKDAFIKYYKPLGVTFEEALTIVTLHELGHQRDKNLKQKWKEKNKYHELWRTTNVPKGSTKFSVSEARKNIAVVPYMIKEEQITYDLEALAWELAYLMNQEHQLVSYSAFMAIQKRNLATYSQWLYKAVDSYNSLKLEATKNIA